MSVDVQVKNIFAALNEARVYKPVEKCECGHEKNEGKKFCTHCGRKNEQVEDTADDEPKETEVVYCPDCGELSEKCVCEVTVDPVEEYEEDPEEDPEDVDLFSGEGTVDSLEDSQAEEDPVEEDDDSEDNEREFDQLDKYNEDNLEVLNEMLTRAKAPSVIMKAFENKMYETCQVWLKRRTGVTLDLSEGLSKKEVAMLEKKLSDMKAPPMVTEALKYGRYSVVAAFLKK